MGKHVDIGYFKKHTRNSIFSWELIAAISYQESHWNHKAVSKTKVKGLMMLTKDTASYIGIKDRLDPNQSVYGGVKYLENIFKRLPKSIIGSDRIWMTLAAYNVGLGHLEDARIITERFGHNPNYWSDVKKHLPLLRLKKFYKNTKYGYARGKEPVNYVKRIQDAGKYTNEADVVNRFVPCMCAGLAYYMAMKKAPQRTQEMKLIYEDEIQRALQEDGSPASVYISPKTYYPEI